MARLEANLKKNFDEPDNIIFREEVGAVSVQVKSKGRHHEWTIITEQPQKMRQGIALAFSNGTTVDVNPTYENDVTLISFPAGIETISTVSQSLAAMVDVRLGDTLRIRSPRAEREKRPRFYFNRKIQSMADFARV